MTPLLVCAALLSGLATIASDWRGRRRPLFYVAKPLTTLLITALAWVSQAGDADYREAVVIALSLCLAGDVALMFRSTRAFLLGLSAFLLAHLVFAVAFITPGMSAGWTACVTAALFAAAVPYGLWLRHRSNRPIYWLAAIYLYALALIGMIGMAGSRAEATQSATAWLTYVGALLFAVSDAVLAYRKFVVQPWWGQPLTLVSYYVAIGLIAWAP